MEIFLFRSSRSRRMNIPQCTDPVIGDILSGWRYDISGLSTAMRTDYDQHLSDCAHCRRRQHLARTIDVLLISVTSLSILAFLLAAVVLHRIEAIAHVGNLVHARLHHTAITISLEAVAIAGMLVSMLLWALVAIATPLPGLFTDAVQQWIPPHIRERIMKHPA
jgi:hypothetical protein